MQLKIKKIKIMIDFDKNECSSIKSIAIKGNMTINVTARFIKGKMLMFSKVSIRSFVYDLIDVLCFPNVFQRVFMKSKILLMLIFIL